ncbi:MAG: DUF2975 domain-containing protein [Ruminococcus sp.]|nr:DUF2975 domain-containing protein [Ruminococcus sp.]MCM1381512.1 DUF2975 domain-containing protein [Muribaculaceae bacterium]MCM1480864.1 DUF2975 domain-containing protein [Muribaculaceae bacterium]
MKKLKNYTAKDYNIVLIPVIIIAAFSEIMFLWNFADTLSRAVDMLGRFPENPDVLYWHLCTTADSFAVVVDFVLLIALLYSIRKAATPFTAFVGKSMRALAVSMVLPYVFSFVLKIVLTATIAAPSENYTGYFGIGGVSMAFLIFILSLVFDYGCKLQRESDETL